MSLTENRGRKTARLTILPFKENFPPKIAYRGDLVPVQSFGKTSRQARTRVLAVRPRPGKPTEGLLNFNGMVFPCALGRGGIKTIKREGDGATPLGQMRLIAGHFRKGRHFSPRSKLPLAVIREGDGWCDAPGDRNYNRPVKLPYPASAETMMRADRLYDCCIVLDYNIRPRRRGMGSAIFFHIARENFAPTEGCVAVSPQVMARLLPYLSRRSVLKILR